MAFHWNEFLSQITFEPDSKLNRIERRAFVLVNILKRIQLPWRLEYIGDRCFEFCGSLEEVTFERGSLLREIGEFAFSKTSVTKIEIPDKCEVLNGLSLIGVTEVSISRRNPFFIIDDSFLKSRDKKIVIRYLGNEEVVYINKDIEIIGSGCFYCRSSLRKVRFEWGTKLRIIDKYAFRDSLERIRIPSNIKVIDELSISRCTKWDCYHMPQHIRSSKSCWGDCIQIFPSSKDPFGC
jgi:hypothetical protein